jgi:hypothetical protein
MSKPRRNAYGAHFLKPLHVMGQPHTNFMPIWGTWYSWFYSAEAKGLTHRSFLTDNTKSKLFFCGPSFFKMQDVLFLTGMLPCFVITLKCKKTDM